MRECKRPGMTSPPHSSRVYRLSRPGAVSARSVGAAAVSPGGDLIICPFPTGVLRSNTPRPLRLYTCAAAAAGRRRHALERASTAAARRGSGGAVGAVADRRAGAGTEGACL